MLIFMIARILNDSMRFRLHVKYTMQDSKWMWMDAGRGMFIMHAQTMILGKYCGDSFLLNSVVYML